MLIYEYKLDGNKQQYAAIDGAIRVVQFIRNKCLRLWMDGRRINKNDCRRTHKFAKGGRYASGQENGEDMCQILIGSLGYILLLNIPESRHHTFISHLRCQSQHETGRICL